MVEDRFHPSVGILRYGLMPDGSSRLVAEIDPDICYLARTLVPRAYGIKRQKYEPHISIVRHEVCHAHPAWGKHEGASVPFEYGSYVFDDGTYFWLRVRSPEFISLRLELGLTEHSRYSRPPDGTRWFHTTVGNIKP